MSCDFGDWLYRAPKKRGRVGRGHSFNEIGIPYLFGECSLVLGAPSRKAHGMLMYVWAKNKVDVEGSIKAFT